MWFFVLWLTSNIYWPLFNKFTNHVQKLLGYFKLNQIIEIISSQGRYEIMRNYMPKVGSLGLDMMFRTCTVQVCYLYVTEICYAILPLLHFSIFQCFLYSWASHHSTLAVYPTYFALNYEIHEFWYKQVNLDFSSESDMIRKFRAGLALQPVGTIFFHLKYLLFLLIFSNFLLNQIATAIFANSPFTEGKPNGYLSMRRLLLTPCSSCTMFNLTWPMWIHFQLSLLFVYCSQIWTDTDNNRTGMLPFVFDDSFG